MTYPMGMAGGTPELRQGKANPLADVYGRMWARPEYRRVSPGEQAAPQFLAVAKPPKGSVVLDIGCGTGRAALYLAVFGNAKVVMVDFVRNCLDDDIRQMLTTQAHALSFVKADLEVALPVVAPYGFCADVMEHIPPDKVDRVLDHILTAAQHCFFTISTVKDQCGALIGEDLHLTIQPADWWLAKFRARGCLIHWSEVGPASLAAYVTGWATGDDVLKSGQVNTAEAAIRDNVRANLAAGWDQVHPFPRNETEVMIVGGGPTLGQFVGDIREKRAAGVKLVTMNGAYPWAIEHGFTPSATIVVDARPFNARFTKPVINGFNGDGTPLCYYFLASQVHPSVLDGLPRDRTRLFHTMPSLVGDLLTAHYGTTGWHTVPGGSTVLMRTIPLLLMLGFHRFHLYGCDSCLMTVAPATNGHPAAYAHHAFAQPENDTAPVLPVTTLPGGRIFFCHPWMIAQAQEFLMLAGKLADVMDLEIYGDGLLAYVLHTGADLHTEEEDN